MGWGRTGWDGMGRKRVGCHGRDTGVGERGRGASEGEGGGRKRGEKASVVGRLEVGRSQEASSM